MKLLRFSALCLVLVVVVLCANSKVLFAQNGGLGAKQNNNAPLEITADGSLEWLREEKIFIARGNALAAQGPSSVKAETLTARYKEKTAGGGMEIQKVEAAENVIIESNQSKAYGDKAVYDLEKSVAILTGKDLKMTSADQIVMARDQFEYWVEEGRLNALGQAKVVRPKPEGGSDTLEADKISALMKDGRDGKRTLHSLEAIGNVVITSPTEKITGTYGIYRADSNTAEITGGVKIVRGPNTLQGDRAQVDLNTNTSKIFGTSTAGGRVKGVFYPDSEKKADP